MARLWFVLGLGLGIIIGLGSGKAFPWAKRGLHFRATIGVTNASGHTLRDVVLQAGGKEQRVAEIGPGRGHTFRVGAGDVASVFLAFAFEGGRLGGPVGTIEPGSEITATVCSGGSNCIVTFGDSNAYARLVQFSLAQ